MRETLTVSKEASESSDDWTVLGDALLNLNATVESGQPLTFHSDYSSGNGRERLRYTTSIGIIEMECMRKGYLGSLRYRYYGGYSKSSAGLELEKRLGLRDNILEIYDRINTDGHLGGAINELYGMRVTHNDPWETTLCFVISQFNNIKRIRGIVRRLRENFGEVANIGEQAVRLFPKPEAIADASIEELMACGAGFRARYIKGIAKECSERIDLNKAYGMDYAEAKEFLMELDGIGEKVADCILLMGYKKLEAFPIDVWIKRSMERFYFNGRKQSIRRLHEFAEKRWEDYAGYAQQYLFHNARLKRIR